MLTGGCDIARSPGIEIGPRDAPLIEKSDGPIQYADYADADTIRANLHGGTIDPETVRAVDIVTGGGSLAAVAPHQVSYIVASHVAEHVPDLLGWLIDLHAVLTPDGTLGLAIPDRRFTFDRFRRESTIAEATEAYLLRATRPSLRQVFDSAWPAVEIGVDEAWRNDIPEHASAEHRMARLAPRSIWSAGCRPSRPITTRIAGCLHRPRFSTCWNRRRAWICCRYTLQNFHPTEPYGYEFYAVLRRADGDHAAATLASIQAARQKLAVSSGEKIFELFHAPAQIAALENALAQMQSSRFWRLTAPLRALVDRLRG